jgi:hypothetical protein
LLIINKYTPDGLKAGQYDSSYGKTGRKEKIKRKKGHPIWAPFSNILFETVIKR